MSGGSSLELGPGYRLAVADDPAKADVEVLPNGLEAFNERQWPQHPPWRPLAVFVRSEGEVGAGLAGETYCGWLFIKYLWVSDNLRLRGVGRELIVQAEARARERSCRSARVDTFSFQAPGFYKKMGYEEFGQLDYPPDHHRHFLRKQLVSPE
jgi:GNAT superfamily N-acetyltransferase